MSKTKLTQQEVYDTNDAINIFAQTSGSELPLVLVPTDRSCLSYFMFVPDGVHVIMHKFGAEVQDVHAGFGFYPPWNKIAFLVSKQSCSYNAPVKGCPTKDNVRVQIDLTIVFRIDDAKVMELEI
jgi:hypothetical protein